MSNKTETDRLTLVPLTKEDISSFHAVWSNAEATQWSIHGPCVTVEESEGRMSGILRSPDHDNRRSWAVYLSELTEPYFTIGIITLLCSPTDKPERSGQWELGYLFRPEAWGEGFATESCKAAIENLERDFPGRGTAVFAAVDVANRKSMRVLAKLGFVIDEHKIFGGSKRWLGGDWRPHQISFFTKQLQSTL